MEACGVAFAISISEHLFKQSYKAVILMEGATQSIEMRDHSSRQLLETVRQEVNADAVLLTTTLPRGGLQVVQPADVPEGLVKAYSAGFDADDKLSWRTIAEKTPLRLRDAWAEQNVDDSPYSREFLAPRNLEFGFAIPLKGPVMGGYPGALHLLRSERSGDFSDANMEAAAKVIEQFDDANGSRKKERTGGSHPRPNVYVSVVDRYFHDKLGPDGPVSFDSRLREQMQSAADQNMQSLNGEPTIADRLQIPDSVGQHWNFRTVTYRKYPALGEGPFTFFCLQPDCGEWSSLRNVDFNGDPELARLIPALRFMEKEFPHMPTLSAIAGSVHLSPFHFHRRFSELLGITPKQFLLDCQIELAKKELTLGQKPLARIAKDAGFAHQSHFTSRFKQSTGLTPTRWRRLQTQREASNN
jgi:AraC-like DNA-binding protein